MGVRWLRLTLLLIAAIVIHDGYMAVSGHGMAEAAPVANCGSSEIQSHHHAPDRLSEDEPVPPNPLDVVATCDDLRTAAPLNREMGPVLADIPEVYLSSSTIWIQFAATSRAIVESPPVHPPDVIRALLQVYRI